ncbi:hypothetical protein ACFOON_09000 [Novosphingobium piscinae]|uniref:DUF4136 domain-containing protein n=1 Tax=Novosphingobium piscinae TaxID=1507448 RepID=A0A7X1FZ62_9SPHN|nr:hypothetical protein [Novosphingobium piscinae]MBC2669097.1 hypothetical protein [Novosphingobium piscinae]
MQTHWRAPTQPAARLARPLVLALATGALVLSLPGVAKARPGGGGWGGRGWGGGGGWNGDLLRGSAAGPTRAGPPEDRVTVASFVTEDPADAATLRRGAIAVTGAPTGSGVESGELAVYSAAVVDQLAQLGYRTDVPDPSAEQVTELHIAHATLQPEEVKRPVSGTMAVGVSNFGTAYGLAVNIDLTKPKTALISTTLEARIRDRASGRVLWEGRADIATRAGDDRWPAGAIASKLAAALFDHFPVPSSPPS